MSQILDEVEQLSETLRVEPLKPGEKAVFKLCIVGKKEGAREEPSCPDLYQLSAKEQIMDRFIPIAGKKDKFTAKRKTIATHIKEYKETKNGMKAIYEAPQFVRGYCTVTAENNSIYERLMRSKNCVSNKFRKSMGAGKDLFILVEDTKELQDQLHISYIQFQAETIVRGGTWTELKAIATTLNQSPDQRLHVTAYQPGISENLPAIKMTLINLSKLYPKQVISASSNERSKLNVQVFEGMQFGVLIYEKNAYHILGEGSFVEIHKPDADKEPIESLIEYLMSGTEEATAHYVSFVSQLKSVLSPKG